jgi:hypothetical protein
VAQRLIDIPLESLPFVDERSVSIDASAQATWAALLRWFEHGSADSGPGQLVVRGLDCEPAQRKGAPGRIGSTIPGFIVARAVPPAVLALMGEHRFSRYALVFRITERIDAPVLLSAETRAEFPGLRGRAYRTLVIGSRAHVLVTARMLRGIRRSAEKHAAG